MQEFTFHIVEVAFSDLQMYAKKYLALIFSKIYCLESYIANTFILKIEGYTTWQYTPLSTRMIASYCLGR